MLERSHDSTWGDGTIDLFRGAPGDLYKLGGLDFHAFF